jgi:hypothetical protein
MDDMDDSAAAVGTVTWTVTVCPGRILSSRARGAHPVGVEDARGPHPV